MLPGLDGANEAGEMWMSRDLDLGSSGMGSKPFDMCKEGREAGGGWLGGSDRFERINCDATCFAREKVDFEGLLLE